MYLDTCSIITLIWSRDSTRGYLNLGNRKAESVIRRTHPRLVMSMPATGETICKIRDKIKDRDELMEVFSEMDRLLRKGFIEISYLRDGRDTFRLAGSISGLGGDDRDAISPMDALIVASAANDPGCGFFCSADTKLSGGTELSDFVNEWRSDKGYGPISFVDLRRMVP